MSNPWASVKPAGAWSDQVEEAEASGSLAGGEPSHRTCFAMHQQPFTWQLQLQCTSYSTKQSPKHHSMACLMRSTLQCAWGHH